MYAGVLMLSVEKETAETASGTHAYAEASKRWN